MILIVAAAATDSSTTSTFETFDSIVAAIALIVAFEAWRTRPVHERIRHERRATEVQHAEA
jgi:hypothetical protein